MTLHSWIFQQLSSKNKVILLYNQNIIIPLWKFRINIIPLCRLNSYFPNCPSYELYHFLFCFVFAAISSNCPFPSPVLCLVCWLCLLTSTRTSGRAEVSSCTSKPVSSAWAQSLTSFWASLEVGCVTRRPSSDDSDGCKLQGQGF